MRNKNEIKFEWIKKNGCIIRECNHALYIVFHHAIYHLSFSAVNSIFNLVFIITIVSVKKHDTLSQFNLVKHYLKLGYK